MYSIGDVNKDERDRLKGLEQAARRGHVVSSISDDRSVKKSLRGTGLNLGARSLGYSSSLALGDAVRQHILDKAEEDAQTGAAKIIKGVPDRRPSSRMQCREIAASLAMRGLMNRLTLPIGLPEKELRSAKAAARCYHRMLLAPPSVRAALVRVWGFSLPELETAIRIFHARWRKAGGGRKGNSPIEAHGLKNRDSPSSNRIAEAASALR